MQLSLLKSDKVAKYFSDFADVSSICIKLAVQNSLLVSRDDDSCCST